jgi:predicted ribosome quality control (RQC) complex YloA/Tae2 family protein
MRELYTLELVVLTKELKGLEGFYIDKFYELDKNKFRLRLSQKGEKINLQFALPYSINRTNFVEIKEDASNFSLATRKRIAGARIKQVVQLNNDRILMIKLDSKNEEISIILEMFGKGNMIITDPNMKILLAYLVHDFKDRSIRPGADYKTPKNQSINITDTNELKELRKEAETVDANMSVIGYLSKRVGIGTMYLEEAILRSKNDPEAKFSELKSNEKDALFESIESLIKECIEKPKFVTYKLDSKIINFSICKIEKYKEKEIEEFKSFEECLDIVLSSAVEIKEEKTEEEEKVAASIKKQSAILASIDKAINENRTVGEFILNNMHELNELLEKLKSSKTITKEELNRLNEKIEVLNINNKNKTIRIKPK